MSYQNCVYPMAASKLLLTSPRSHCRSGGSTAIIRFNRVSRSNDRSYNNIPPL